MSLSSCEFNSHRPHHTGWAIGSVGEHFVHTEGVTGSNPVSPTIPLSELRYDCFGVTEVMVCFHPCPQTEVMV